MDTPSAIDIESGSQTSFDVTIENFGAHYADVSITSRSLPDGISIVDSDGTKLIDIGKRVAYHITIAASRDIAPGTYRFEIADESSVDPHTWKTIEVRVRGEGNVKPTGVSTDQDQKEDAKKSEGSPGFEAIAAVFVLMLVYRLRYIL
ncbi:hypothetical protein DRN77_03325 [Methanosarcinales archaeon]|nr:MAG: hypothetical protein DRN77_03325 [Methanosarcinales archaeon]